MSAPQLSYTEYLHTLSKVPVSRDLSLALSAIYYEITLPFSLIKKSVEKSRRTEIPLQNYYVVIMLIMLKRMFVTASYVPT